MHKDTNHPKYENPLFERKKDKLNGNKKRKRIIWTGIIIILVCFISSLIYFRDTGNYISLAIISGNSRHTDEQVTKVINETLSGTYAVLYPKKNKYLAPKEDIITALTNTFFYSDVIVEKIYSQNSLHVTVIELPLQYVLQYSDIIRYVAQDGTLLETVEQEALESNELLRISVPESFIIRNDEIESQYVNQDIIDLVTRISDEFKNFFTYQVTQIEFTTDSAEDVKIHTNQEWFIYIDSSKPISEQLQNASNVFTQNIKGTAQEATLEYIDVRVPSRAYYK